MSGYVVGELVDVTMRGVRVAAVVPVAGTTVLRLRMDEDEIDLALVTGITVTRVAPAEWPPQIGDVWDDGHSGSWWTRYHDGEPHLQSETGGVDEPGWVLERYGPMKLAYRRGWTPESAAVEPVVPEVLDKRIEAIAGMRELTDWLEANPDVPLPSWTRLGVSLSINNLDLAAQTDAVRRAELLRIADVLGVPASLDDAHPRVGRKFRGGVAYDAYYIPRDEPAAEPAPAETGRPAPVVTGDGAATQTLLAVEEVGGSGAGDGEPEPPTGPADEPVRHAHVGGTAGPDGTNAAECACGVVFAGFDSHAEATAVLDQHIADAAVIDPVLFDEPEPAAEVWVAVRRRGINYHDLGDDGRTTCNRGTDAGLRLPLTEVRDLGCPRCPDCQRKSEG